MNVIDLAFKQEQEKESKLQLERLENINKKFADFADKMIKEYEMRSSEYLAILNNMMATEINAKVGDLVNNKARNNINARNNIMRKN